MLKHQNAFCDYTTIILEMQNTRHSSGLGVNAKNINSIVPDECPDDSSGTHQVLIRVVLAVYQKITG